MNNLLINKLPQNIEIGGFEVKINSDFRTSVQFEGLLKDNKLSNKEIWLKAFDLYLGFIPKQEFVEEAISKMMWFYRCGKEIEEDRDPIKRVEEILSYEHDADKIFGAFLDQYGIDLQEVEYLHWWKFKALFGALKEDNEISKIMSYRAMDINSIPKEQREHYKKIKKIYAIPIPEEDKKENDALTQALLQGKDISEFL